MQDHAFETRLDALAAVWRIWAEVGAGLTDADWRHLSRCEGWTVADVFAHHSQIPLALASLLPIARDSGVEGDAVVVSAVDILRGYNRPGGLAHEMAQRVADHAVREVRAVAREELIARFTKIAPRAVDGLRASDPSHLLHWPAAHGLVPLVEALRIVLMEATVHLLDVLAALRREPGVPEAALRETAVLQTEMADPVKFIELATGRSRAAVLPVLR